MSRPMLPGDPGPLPAHEGTGELVPGATLLPGGAVVLEGGRELPLATEEAYYRSLAERARERPQVELLTFHLADQEYAVGIRRLREIIRPVKVTPVPRVAPFILGVISLRGGIVPVLDLRLRLRLPAAPVSPSARILVVVRDGEPYGLLVDRVRQVVRMPLSDVEPTPAGLTGADLEFLQGIGRFRDRLLILLDLDPVLALRPEDLGLL